MGDREALHHNLGPWLSFPWVPPVFLAPVPPWTVGSTSATLYSKISTNKNPSVTSLGVSILGLGQGWGINHLYEVSVLVLVGGSCLMEV